MEDLLVRKDQDLENLRNDNKNLLNRIGAYEKEIREY